MGKQYIGSEVSARWLVSGKPQGQVHLQSFEFEKQGVRDNLKAASAAARNCP